jgi:hypothetical protein
MRSLAFQLLSSHRSLVWARCRRLNRIFIPPDAARLITQSRGRNEVQKAAGV